LVDVTSFDTPILPNLNTESSFNAKRVQIEIFANSCGRGKSYYIHTRDEKETMFEHNEKVSSHEFEQFLHQINFGLETEKQIQKFSLSLPLFLSHKYTPTPTCTKHTHAHNTHTHTSFD
jgi:hypothetical protein